MDLLALTLALAGVLFAALLIILRRMVNRWKQEKI
jgi:hypothetical protein